MVILGLSGSITFNQLFEKHARRKTMFFQTSRIHDWHEAKNVSMVGYLPCCGAVSATDGPLNVVKVHCNINK